ncbi:lysine biosynthesis protein LysW [Candidatus Leptofilum sp.]|uniref:lysine biosynthesis protein LysW n=1 Tax=Candidatus Leptofilum sp. TaxID=3241576 RepID=UPI003B59D5BD
MNNVNCVECAGEVEVADDVMVGEIVECPECGAELEVIGTNPPALTLAPEVEEDWGE